MKHQSSQDEVRVNVPELYLVSAKDLKSPILVFEENLGLCESWQGKQYVWSVKDRRTKWSHLFPLATWRLGTSVKPSDLQQFCWCEWLK
jgi:hypothetical protein